MTQLLQIQALPYQRRYQLPVKGGPNTAYLLPNNWDDYGYKTTFGLVIYDQKGDKHSIGDVKIGSYGQIWCTELSSVSC